MNNNERKNQGKTPEELRALFAKKDLPENFCVIPFVNLIFNPSGEVGVCRQKGTDHVVGHLDNDTPEAIWNNEYLQRWREEFLTGNVQICSREVKEDFCHLGTFNYEYFDDVQLSKTQDKMPKKFTANFNGKCNLECVMCDVWKMPNNYYDKINFWEKAERDFYPYIKEMELLSGEPFVQKDTWRLIDIVSRVNPGCAWSFTTNAHWKLNKKIKLDLDKINIKNVQLSIDSLIPEKYAQIRKLGSLKTVLKNVSALKVYEKEREEQGRSKLGLSLHSLIMKDNWKELESFIHFCDVNEIYLILDLLRVPNELSLLSLPEKKRLEILLYYFESLNANEVKRGSRILLPLIYSLSKKEQKSMLIKLIGKQNEAG